MNYADGQEVHLNDRVKLGADSGGVVVCVIETGQYTAEYPESQWGYLGKGLMILFPRFGLIHYDEPEEDIELLAHA